MPFKYPLLIPEVGFKIKLSTPNHCFNEIEPHYRKNMFLTEMKTKTQISCALSATQWATWEIRIFTYAKKKRYISCALIAQLISAFVFSSWILNSRFLNLKFQASGRLLWRYILVCVGPVLCFSSHVLVQSGLCQTWSETTKTDFLMNSHISWQNLWWSLLIVKPWHQQCILMSSCLRKQNEDTVFYMKDVHVLQKSGRVWVDPLNGC